MKVLIAAGGTGGHVNPALALAQEIKSRYPDAEILFVGTENKLEATLVPKAGFAFSSIDVTGFQRSFAPADIIYNLGTLRRLLSVTGKCKKIIREFSPDVAVGFGGYVSGPVIRAAHKMGIKTAIHEQNAFPGKTNIALSRYVDAVMLTSPEAKKHLRCKASPSVTGLPVRKEILATDKETARKELGIGADETVVLSTGGSLGAAALNDAMCGVISSMADSGIVFIHGYGQNGRDVPEKLKQNGADPEKNKKLFVSEYIYDMAKYMAAADLVISRAGASSLAEIKALGKASYLIPYPYASENHQYHNAMSLVNNNAAMVCEQSQLSADKLRSVIEDLLADKQKYVKIGNNARNLAILDAQKKICDIVVGLVNNNGKTAVV